MQFMLNNTSQLAAQVRVNIAKKGCVRMRSGAESHAISFVPRSRIDEGFIYSMFLARRRCVNALFEHAS